MTSLYIFAALACTNGKISAGEANTSTSSDASTVDTEEETPASAEELGEEAGEDTEEGLANENEETEETEDGVTDEGELADEPSTDDEFDTGMAETEETEETEETAPPAEEDTALTVEDYVTTYCATFAVPCVGYPTVESCVDSMMEIHFEGCTLADPVALAECDAWVATITCDETSWLPACDEFIDCD